jgi:hypothetical protein
MNDSDREKNAGFDFEYLIDIPQEKETLGNKYQTPGFGIGGQLFAMVAKSVIEKLGKEEGEKHSNEETKGAIEYIHAFLKQ